MRSQDSSAVHDTVTNAIDTVLIMEDPALRLEAFAYLLKQARQRFTRERNRAAYEARLQYDGLDLADLTGCDRKDIYRWATRYADENRLPVPRRARRLPLNDAPVIAHAVGVYDGNLEH